MSKPLTLNIETVWFEVVTGCSSGIGKSLAQTIYKAGHYIVATARDSTSLSYLPDGPTVLKLTLDVTSQEAIIESVSDAIAQFKRIDVFINNAGYGLMGDMESIPEADARHQLEINFWGPVHVTKEALRVFREVNPHGQGGTVVQISSIGGRLTAPGHSFYHASKFALEGFTESVAKEVDPDWNIKFLIVAPGGVRTNFAASGLKLASRHPAYDVPVSSFSQLLNHISNIETQSAWCDPDVCARVLYDCVVGQHERLMPTRLLMGREAIHLTRKDVNSTLADIDSWEDQTVLCSQQRGTSSGK